MKFAENKGEICRFDPKWHTYTISGNRRLPSVSKFIRQYKEPFDPDGSIVARKAAENGITPAEMAAQWRAKADLSVSIGNNVHECAENILSNNAMPEPVNEQAERMFSHVIAVCDFLRSEYEILGTEQILFSPELNIAGTADIVARNKSNGCLAVFDWKTNHDFGFDNPFQNLLPPFDYLSASHYYEYSIQLNLYALMIRHDGFFGCQIEDDIDTKIIHIMQNAYRIIPAERLSKKMLTGTLKKTEYSIK